MSDSERTALTNPVHPIARHLALLEVNVVPRTRKAALPRTVGHADIVPTGIYSIDWLRGALNLGYDSLRREIREGRLRAKVRCGKRFILGQWLIDWLVKAEEVESLEGPEEKEHRHA